MFCGVVLWRRVVFVPPRALERDDGANGVRQRVGRRELMKRDTESDLRFHGSTTDGSERAGRNIGMDCHDDTTTARDN